ncbi:GNAT family N-acetyltransferase [Sulfitobacter guttiformis]|uniref:Ribosomal protein S18 acetylase RimI-like enzyme n=1 Tax=Sulfitobacter guttiformis TaxID=74349 RepID=A0A420DR94_9RHOB|nr:GNAT family N-acetyltransferase [Sulfitobacter guttiformis]KIN74093.1 Acetyltransferase [Sulfitobacter guttiformis KCTC 32187]RKE96710.1 ribosomal protein S18 acetylase RimI-like enzyme [Sulfitobacter guttiformis]
MSSGKIIIEAAVPSDTAALSALAYRAKRAKGYDDATMVLLAEALLLTPARLSKHKFWVARDGAEILGCIALAAIEKTTAEIRAFYVAPEHQGRGVGTRLWQNMVFTAQCQGVTLLHGQVDEPSLAFYRRLGFRSEKTLPSCTVPSLTIYYMVCDI